MAGYYPEQKLTEIWKPSISTDRIPLFFHQADNKVATVA